MKDITNFFNDMIFASNNGSPNTEKKKDINNNPEKTNSTNIDKDSSNNTENNVKENITSTDTTNIDPVIDNDTTNIIKNKANEEVTISIIDNNHSFNATNTTPNVDWDIQPSTSILETSTIIDELPHNEEIHKQAIKHSIDKILEPSFNILSSIEQYCKKFNVPIISINGNSDQQTFSINNVTYLLTDTSHTQDIYNILQDLSNPDILTNILSKRPPTLRNILDNLLDDTNILKHPVIIALDFKTRNILLERILTLQFNDNILQKMKNNKNINNATGFVEFFTNQTCLNIGRVFFEHYMMDKYIYNLQHGKLSKVKSRTNKELLQICVDLEKKTGGTPFDKCVISYIKNFMFCNIKINEIDIPDITADEKAELNKLYYAIGGQVVSWLIKNNIFEEIQPSSKMPPTLRLVNQTYNELFISASYQRPPISLNYKQPSFEINVNSNTVIQLGLDSREIPNDSYVRIQASPHMLFLLDQLKTTPMCVDNEQFLFLKQLLEEITLHYENVKDNIKEDKFIHSFLKLFYNIDFEKFFEKYHNADHELCEAIMEFGLNFHESFDDLLKARCKNNIACENAYNKMSSTKLYMKGLLNDANIYRHFNHFYIPYYVTNTARIYPQTYFLQLQGSKIVRGLLYYKGPSQLTDQHLVTIHKIIEKEIPNFPKPTLHKNLKEYENQFLGLYNNFLKALLKPSSAHLSSYPLNGTLKEQLLWLSDNIKKSEDILLLKSLIHARLNNTYTQRLYEKDATSSGLQIISMLIRDPKLAQLTNVTGSSYNDIYDNLILKIIDDLNMRKVHVTRFLEHCLNIKSIQEFVTYNDKNTDTVILKSLLTSVNKHVFDTVFEKYILDLKKKNLALYNNLNNFKFELPSDIREIENIYLKDKLYKTLFKLREYTQDILLYEKLPPNLLHRKLVKVIVMALGYSQRDLGRIDTLVEQVQKFFVDNGYSKVPLTEDEIKHLATYINGQFHKTCLSDLVGVTEFMKIITDFTNDK